jgi:hypothetical protein
MPIDFLQVILRYLLPPLANTIFQELALWLRQRCEKHAVDVRGSRSKGHNQPRVARGYRLERIPLHIFSNGNLGYSVINCEGLVSKVEHHRPSEGEAICIWICVFVEMVLSFMVLGLSNSPYFLVDAHLQLLGLLATGLCILIAFIGGFVALNVHESRE